MDSSAHLRSAVVGFVFFVAAALLLLSWLQRRDLAPLALWGLAFGVATGGTCWSPPAANLRLLVDRRRKYSDRGRLWAMWSGARLLDGRRLSILSAAWRGRRGLSLLSFAPGFFADSHGPRRSCLVPVNASYSVATAAELWRSRSDRLPSRWPAIALLLLHAAGAAIANSVRQPIRGARPGGLKAGHFRDLRIDAACDGRRLSIRQPCA